MLAHREIAFRRKPHKGMNGVSLVEMMISLLLLSILITTLFYLTNSVNRVNYSMRLYEELKSGGQNAIRSMDRNIIRGKKFFDRDSPYEDIIPYSELPDPVSFSKLPSISPTASLNPETSEFDSSIFGNELFFAKIENGASFTVESRAYDINLYRFVCFYLTKDTTREIRPYNYCLALVKWESVRYADYLDLEHIWSDSATHPLDSIKYTLENDFGVKYCWDVSESNPNLAFYRIGSMDTPVSIVLGTNSLMYLVKPINQTIGVSFNKSDSFPVKSDVPGFSSVDNEFPGGLEIAVIGPSSSRKILIRLVVAGWTRKRVLDFPTMTIVSAPEY